MKKIIFKLIFTACMLLYVTEQPLLAQQIVITYNKLSVPICYSSSIDADTLSSADFSPVEKESAKQDIINPNGKYGYLGISSIISEATAVYNCHAYAWYMYKGGSPLCIQDLNGSGNLSKFWNYSNGCFVEVTESEADIVYYYDGDHSALVDHDNPGYYISKWGTHPLVRHLPDQVPNDYISANRTYYKYDTDLQITGPNVLNSGQSFTYYLGTVNQVVWTFGNNSTQQNNFIITSFNNSSVTVLAPSIASSPVYLLAKVSNNCTVMKTISVNNPGYQVSFNLNGAPGSPPTTQIVSSGSYASAPSPAPAWPNSGKYFNGWYDNVNCTGSAVNFSAYPITSNKTFYAKWVAPGIDFVIHNNMPYSLGAPYIGLTGKINNISTSLISADPGSIPSGGSASGSGYDLSQSPGTAITDLQLTFFAVFSGSGYVTVSASVDVSGGSSSKNVSIGDNTFNFSINPNTTVPNGIRRIVNVYISL